MPDNPGKRLNRAGSSGEDSTDPSHGTGENDAKRPRLDDPLGLEDFMDVEEPSEDEPARPAALYVVDDGGVIEIVHDPAAATEYHTKILGMIDEATAELPGLHSFFARALAIAKFAGPHWQKAGTINGMAKNDIATIIALARLELGWRITKVGLFKRRQDRVAAWGSATPMDKEAKHVRLTKWDPDAATSLRFLIPALHAITVKNWSDGVTKRPRVPHRCGDYERGANHRGQNDELSGGVVEGKGAAPFWEMTDFANYFHIRDR